MLRRLSILVCSVLLISAAAQAQTPVTDDTVIGDPVVGDPVVGNPVVGNPVDGETVVGETVAGETIATIRIESRHGQLVESARGAIVQRVGEPYSFEAIQASLQNLIALGSVADVTVLSERRTDGLHLIFRLQPLMRLRHITLLGEIPGGKRRARRSLTLREGQPLDARAAANQATRLQQALADNGYLLARVAASIQEGDLPTRGILQLRVTPGSRTRLQSIRLVGDTGVTAAQASVIFGLQPGRTYRPAELEAGLERLQASLIEHRFFFAQTRVVSQSLDLAANSMALEIEIQSGPRVLLQLAGLDVQESQLHELLSIFEFGSVDDWALKESRAQIVRYLQERGHWRPLVSYSRQRDDQGRNVRVQIRILPGPKAKLKLIAFEGNDNVATAELLAAVRSRESAFLDSSRFISTHWEQDQRAVLTAYRRRGYRQAEIVETPVRLDPEIGGVVASMRIFEGDQTLLADVRLEIEANGPTPGIALPVWANGLAQRPGGPFDPGAIRRDANLLRALLANVGYPRGLVIDSVERTDAGPAVTYRIVPGERARVGRVLIAGNETTHDDVIRRELSFIAGSPYSFTDILETQSRLYRLGIFSQVDVTPAVPDDLAADRSVVVRVQEGPPIFYAYGAGFDTDERLRGTVAVGHSNLFGRNEQLTLSARASVREQRVRLLFREPYFLGRRMESTATGFYTNTKEPSFDVQRLGGSFQLLLTHNPALASIFRYTLRDVNTFNVQIDPDLLEPEDQSTRVGSLGYALIVDTRLDPIEPNRGTFTTLDADIAVRALGSNTDFVTLIGRSFWYKALGRRVVLATGARAGIKIPFAATERVPLPERFFAGGSTTLRGFPLDQAGPKDDNGNPFGGQVLLIGNVELRIPIRGSLGTVLFVDVGNVFANTHTVTWDNVREDVGIGFRYATPVGPIRLDVARLLDVREGEDRYQLFFSVGHTF